MTAATATRLGRTRLMMAAATLFAGTASASPGQPIGAPITAAGAHFRPNSSSSLDIAANSAGDFVVVWMEISGTNSGGTLFARRFASDGAPAGPAFAVTSEDSNLLNIQVPSVAMDAEGDFVIAWALSEIDDNPLRLTTRRTRTQVLAQRYSADGTAQGGVINVTANGEAPDVAMDDDGDFVVAWTVDGLITQLAAPVYGLPILIPGATLPDSVRLRRYSANGRPLGLVNTLDTGVRDLPISRTPAVNQVRVALDATGNAVAVWSRQNLPGSDDSAIFGQRLSASGLPRGTRFRISGDEANPDGSNGAALAMNGNGRFVVAWTGVDSLRARVYEADGSTVVPAFAVSDPAAAAGLALRASPGVAIDAAGNVAITGYASSAVDAGAATPAGQSLRLFSANATPLTGNLTVLPPQRFGSRFQSTIAIDGAGNLLLRLDNPPQVNSLRVQRFAGAQ